jgi:CRISPR-associated protein (TIGR02584 family)
VSEYTSALGRRSSASQWAGNHSTVSFSAQPRVSRRKCTDTADQQPLEFNMPLLAVPSKPVRERRVLLSVIGITPQVVTETLYALAVLEGRPCPTEIHLIASEEGAHRARLELLAPGRAHLASLCQQYGLPLPRCDESTIHIIERDGNAVTDLRSAEDNEAAADAILDVVRGLTEDGDSSIHFSIAGGRKTMTYYLGYCASLLGRPQDDMSHVMVNLPFEQSPDFFFPPKDSTVIHDRTGRPHSTGEARIDLATVPFLRLRDKLPEALLSKARWTKGAWT